MVAYRSSATGTQTAGTDGTTVTVTKPTGLTSGDTMVAVVHGYLPTTLTAPSGWTLLAGPVADSTALYSWLYTKTAGGSEPSNYTWTWSGTGGSIGVSIAAFSSSCGVESFKYKVTTATDPAVDTGCTVQSETGGLGYHVFAWRDSTADTSTGTGSSTVTEIFDFNAKDSGTIFRGQAGYVNSATTAVSLDVGTVSADFTNSVERGINWTIVLGDAVTNQSWATSGIAVEMYIDNAWTDITSDVRYENGIQITRGQSGEGSAPETTNVTLMLDNTSGKYSPRNPNSTYFGKIGRNTPLRISKAQGTKCFDSLGPAFYYSRFQTVDKSSLSISGDIDVRIDVEPRTWKQTTYLMSKSSPGTGTRQWMFFMRNDGSLDFWWSTDGLNWTSVNSSSILPMSTNKRMALRATLDVNNGSGGYTVTFYYGTGGVAGSWTTLSTVTTTSGTTSIYTGQAVPLSVGQESNDASGDQGLSPFHGKVYRVQVLNGIAGTVVADADFTSQTQGVSSFTDSYSNTWVGYEAGAIVSNRKYRFAGEVSSWPQRWDPTGTDVYVPLEAAGLRRRLEATDSPLRSAIYRDMSTRSSIIAYWPCEEGSASSSVASGLTTGKRMTVTGTPNFAADSRMKGSDPVLQLNSASLSGTVGSYTSTGELSLRFYYNGDSSLATLQNICTLRTSGSAHTWVLGATGPGALYLTQYNSDETTNTDVLNALPTLDSFASTKILVITLELSQSGSNINYAVRITDFTDSNAITNTATVYSDSGTINSQTLGVAKKVTIEPNLMNAGIGHICLANSLTAYADSVASATGYLGEYPATRFSRLCGEESIDADFVGAKQVTNLGYQKAKSFIDLLKECGDTEHGIFYEPREFAGLGFHSYEALTNQPAQLALDYSLFHLSDDLWPDEDDQLIKNDVTVAREDGSQARVEQTTGRLSTSAPPNGVSRYSATQTLSIYQDEDCDDHAQWVLRLGTVDEARYPKVGIALENKRFVASSSLTEDALNTDLGHRITISNPPAWIPPDQISLVVVGYTEVFDQFQHSIIFNCVPASPYDQLGYTDDSSAGRVDTDSSSLSASATAGATSLTVATSDSYRWIDSATYASDFPFDILVGGERMTVTAITGTSSPQTFTVTRSVNGISKTHAVGEEVHVFTPIYVSF